MTKHDNDSSNDDERNASNDHEITQSAGDDGGRSRRGFLRTTGALGAAGLLGAGADAVGRTRAGSTGAAGDPWTVVAIPDSQNMDDAGTVEYADSITDWVVDNVDRRNVAFVTHEGDMVSNGDDERELQNIDDVMSDLDGVVPWSPCVGNHDLMDTFVRDSGASLWKEYFGASRFQGRDYFGGVSDNGRNFYQYFSAGGYDFLHLSLEWEAPGDPADPGTPLGWAQSVLDDHPDRPTILTTHSYLGDSPRERKRDVEEVDGWGTSGQEMWEQLVRPNPQIFMVLNGHNHDLSGADQGEHHQVSTNVAGEPVYEMLANYQDYPNGGDGWFRRIRFEPGGGTDAPDRIQVRTYTAYHDEYQTSDRSEFGFDLDFDSRFAVSGSGGDRDTVTFQQGVAGYDGTVDTQLHEGNPGTEYGDDSSITVDGADDGGEVHGLLRFDDVVGGAADQVPAGATVNAATLSFASTNPGDGAAFHRMLTAWSDTDAWNDWGGIEADGVEAAASADATVSNPDTGTVTVDVTESVQAWADGDPNEGWALLPEGNNGWDFEAAEGATPPELSVVYEGGDGCDATETVRFVSASETASTDDRFQVGRPDGVQAGDVLLLTIAGTANGDDGMPYDQTDRWTRVGICSQDDNGADRCQRDGQDLFMHVYYRVATGDEPGAYTVNTGGNTVASVTAYRNVNVDAPVVSSTGLVDDGDYRVSTCPPTEGVADGMLVCGMTHDDQHAIDDLGELTLRSEDQNGDSSTQVLTKSIDSDGTTDRHEVGHVDPTGNKDLSIAVALRPSPADCEEPDPEPEPDPDGLSLVDATTAEAIWTPDFEVAWPDYVYLGTAVDGQPREWTRMTETEDNRFEATVGNLEAGDVVEYEFSYWENDSWQYTDSGTYTHRPDAGESGPGTARLVHGEGDTLRGGEFLESATGDYRLYLQATDGNLVLRETDTGAALWASDTAGAGGTRLVVQGDGNLVLYTDAGDPVWASDTAGSAATELVLRDDGALVLSDGDAAVWSANGS